MILVTDSCHVDTSPVSAGYLGHQSLSWQASDCGSVGHIDSITSYHPGLKLSGGGEIPPSGSQQGETGQYRKSQTNSRSRLLINPFMRPNVTVEDHMTRYADTQRRCIERRLIAGRSGTQDTTTAGGKMKTHRYEVSKMIS